MKDLSSRMPLPGKAGALRKRWSLFAVRFWARLRRSALLDESGQSLAVWVTALFVMVLMLALVVDGGNAFFHKTEAQNAADAAVLAGAHEMAMGRSTRRIVDAIVTCAVGNGSNSGRYVIDWRNRTVAVSANDNSPVFFAKVAGIEEMKARADAEAKVRPIYEAKRLLPLGVHISDFRVGRRYRLNRDTGGPFPPWLRHNSFFGQRSHVKVRSSPHPENGRLQARRTTQRRARDQAQHQRESLPASAFRRGGRATRSRESPTLSRPGGDGAAQGGERSQPCDRSLTGGLR